MRRASSRRSSARRSRARSRRRDTRAAIVVLAKHPAPGRVKTRLAATIGAGAAAVLARAFVRDLAGRLAGGGFDVWWAYAPAEAPFPRLVRSRRCFAQRGRDLGARIHHAVTQVARATRRPVVALGADAPHVPLGEVRRAAARLAAGADVVLGRARDGGYYLVGLRRPRRALFTAMPWSTPLVFVATSARAHALGLRLATVGASFDVDDARDLVALRRVVARRPREFPATAAALAMIATAQSPRRMASA
jgi:uncharacterized protein